MKAKNLEKTIELLKEKNMTYKELSKITGYHEKSLIRLNKQLKNNSISLIHGNKNQKPHNYINDYTRTSIIEKFQKGHYKSYKEFYLALNKKYSYSFLCKLLSKDNKIEKFIDQITIADNTIEYNNIKYQIQNSNIKRHTRILLNINTMEIFYKNKKYHIVPIKN